MHFTPALLSTLLALPLLSTSLPLPLRRSALPSPPTPELPTTEDLQVRNNDNDPTNKAYLRYARDLAGIDEVESVARRLALKRRNKLGKGKGEKRGIVAGSSKVRRMEELGRLMERQNNGGGAGGAGGVDPALVPEFGVEQGVNPDGTGNCEGVGGKKIPCNCPPARDEFIAQLNANVAAGQAVNNPAVTGVTFPTGDDVDSQLARFNAATVTLQNLEGPGVGCPQVATTFSAQIDAIKSGGSAADAANAGVGASSSSGTGSSSSAGAGAGGAAAADNNNTGSGVAANGAGAAGAGSGAAAADTGAGAASSGPSGSGNAAGGAGGAGGVDPALVPEFGVQQGVNPDGTGNCEGVGGKKIPCNCPPNRDEFIAQLNANVAAGQAVNNPAVTGVTFPTGDDVDSQLARFNAATVTLQNLEGPGVGCPQVATTFSAQIDAIKSGGSAADAANANADSSASSGAGNAAAGNAAAGAGAAGANVAADTGAAAAGSSSGSSTSSAGAAAGGVDPALVPEFGVEQGVNPDGTGNCEGVGGKKIPCNCPPNRDEFLSQLNANVAAGQAVNNPAVTGVTFPTGDDLDSQLARFNAATVTLQNLEGPGVGCPQVATTFSAQIDAIKAKAGAA